MSDYSWGDITYHHQLFYNFLHGRPFQTSVYWDALVYSNNPYHYLNTFNIHFYLSPFIFSLFYPLMPNVSGIYFIFLAVNYVSLAYFPWKLICLFTAEDRFRKYMLLMSFVLTNLFIFSLVVGKAFVILLGTPFILGAYYFLQKEKYALYYLFAILFILSYDDCGFLFISFLPYVYFFERKHLKPAMVTAVLGFLTVALIIGVVQPIARANLGGTSAATLWDNFRAVGDYLRSGHLFTYARGIILNLMLFGTLFLAFPVIWLWSGPAKPQRRDVYQYLGLIFLAPLSHWASLVLNIGVHFMPVALFTVIALTLAVSRSNLTLPGRGTWQHAAALALIGFYLAGNAAAFGYRHRHFIANTSADETRANAHCLRKINQLVPVDKSLTYWTARGLDGFLGNRSDLWKFPHFFDQVDFLVMQKDAKNTFFQAKIHPGEDIYQAIRQGTYHSTKEEVSTDDRVIAAICDKLVKVDRSYTIFYDDPEMVILKRRNPIRFKQPPETRGFGFLRNFSKFWKAKFGSSG